MPYNYSIPGTVLQLPINFDNPKPATQSIAKITNATVNLSGTWKYFQSRAANHGYMSPA
jgi:hypothetical protein